MSFSLFSKLFVSSFLTSLSLSLLAHSNLFLFLSLSPHPQNRTQCADALALPPRSVRLRRDALDDKERDFYGKSFGVFRDFESFFSFIFFGFFFPLVLPLSPFSKSSHSFVLSLLLFYSPLLLPFSLLSTLQIVRSEALYTQSQATFGEYVSAGTLLNNYAHVFDLLVRLRQAVNHPYLVVHSRATREAQQADRARREAVGGGSGGNGGGGASSSSSAAAAAAAAAADAAGSVENVECPICRDVADDPVSSRPCGHACCRECAREWAAAAAASVVDGGGGGGRNGGGGGGGRNGGGGGANVLRCPADGCGAPWSVDLSSRGATPEVEEEGGAGAGGNGTAAPSSSSSLLPFPAHRSAAALLPSFGLAPARRDSILHSIEASSFATSTKLEALREEVERARAEDPGAKVLAFSQFTSMLDLAAFRLGPVGIRSVRLEGGMSMEARAKAISTFTNDPDVPLFLMSLKAGGVALNLTAASRTVIMDPWWNPAVEQQAQDRIHRLGQHRGVTSVRLCVAGSVEQRIVKLQEKKAAIFEGTVGADNSALARLTVDDLRFLFG